MKGKEDNLRKATLLFLIKKDKDKIIEICLAMKKRGFGVGRWNGVGGKVNFGEKIEKAVERETKEEIGVSVTNKEKVAEISFYFPHNPSWNQIVYVYFSDNWQGNIIESEEMDPKWFNIEKIPFNNMWSDDIFWLPIVISGKKIKASFKFKEGDIVEDKEINIINS